MDALMPNVSKKTRTRSWANLSIAMGCIGIVFVSGGLCSVSDAQNSTRKLRVKPNAVSIKVGTAVHWVDSLDEAKAKSKESGKPIFWYVSTLPSTFMDRKTEIDRYMLGGPFSWPPIIDLLNKYFVPVRAIPDRNGSGFGLKPYQFVEPGFLMIGSDGKLLSKVDHVSTFHYQWLTKLLVDQLKLLKVDVESIEQPEFFAEFSGNQDEWVDPYGDGFEESVSNLLLSGMIAFRRGDHELAKKRWTLAAGLDPTSPLAWKASLEAQGIGPFYRGFETFREIPDEALAAGTKSIGSAAPESIYSNTELLTRSVKFLLGMQRSDGAFVDSDYDFGGTDSLPNVYVAVTALCGMALHKANSQLPEMEKEISAAIEKAIDFVSDNKNINPADRDEILWAHSFRLRLLARAMKTVPNARLKAELAEATSDLENIQLKTGNWYHEYNNPFVTATALCALYEAKMAGSKIDESKITRGLASLMQDRAENGSYPYYSARRPQVFSAAKQKQMLLASAGRMPICELALVRWEKKGQKELVAAVKNSLDNHKHLAVAYKYDNHTSNMAYGGFFFWYDMRGRSEAIRAISDETIQMEFRRMQQTLVRKLPEIDGCFIDSHELGRCYGTAMALLSMD